MEFNKPVSNPMLVGCFQLLIAEDTVEHRNMLVNELQNANLLAPAMIEPAPEEDAEGNLRLIPGSKIQFPLLITPDGKQFFMGFTDDIEYQKWVAQNQPLPTFALRFDDYVGMMLNKDAMGNISQALGFVINPYGVNLIVSKDMIAGIMGTRLAHAARTANARSAQKLRVPTAPDKDEDAEKSVGAAGDESEEK